MKLTFSGSAEVPGGLPTPSSTGTVAAGVEFTCDGRAERKDASIVFSGTGLSEFATGFTYHGEATIVSNQVVSVKGSVTLSSGGASISFVISSATFSEVSAGGDFSVSGNGRDAQNNAFTFSVLAQFKEAEAYFSITGTGSSLSLPDQALTTIAGGSQEVACVGSGKTATAGNTITFDGNGRTSSGESFAFAAIGSLDDSGILQKASGTGKTAEGCSFAFETINIDTAADGSATFNIQVSATITCQSGTLFEYIFTGTTLLEDKNSFTFVGKSRLSEDFSTITVPVTTTAPEPQVEINGQGTTNEQRTELQFEGSGLTSGESALGFTAKAALVRDSYYEGTGRTTSEGQSFLFNFTLSSTSADSFTIAGTGR